MAPWTSTPPAERLPRLTEVVDWLPPAGPVHWPSLPEGLVDHGLPATGEPAAADADENPAARFPGPVRRDAPVAGTAPGAGASVSAASAASAASAHDLLRRQVTEAVLADVQRRVALTVDARLRTALAPLLARAADRLVHDAAATLAATLAELVEHAVAHELQRRGVAPLARPVEQAPTARPVEQAPTACPVEQAPTACPVEQAPTAPWPLPQACDGVADDMARS